MYMEAGIIKFGIGLYKLVPNIDITDILEN